MASFVDVPEWCSLNPDTCGQFALFDTMLVRDMVVGILMRLDVPDLCNLLQLNQSIHCFIHSLLGVSRLVDMGVYVRRRLNLYYMNNSAHRFVDRGTPHPAIDYETSMHGLAVARSFTVVKRPGSGSSSPSAESDIVHTVIEGCLRPTAIYPLLGAYSASVTPSAKNRLPGLFFTMDMRRARVLGTVRPAQWDTAPDATTARHVTHRERRAAMTNPPHPGVVHVDNLASVIMPGEWPSDGVNVQKIRNNAARDPHGLLMFVHHGNVAAALAQQHAANAYAMDAERSDDSPASSQSMDAACPAFTTIEPTLVHLVTPLTHVLAQQRRSVLDYVARLTDGRDDVDYDARLQKDDALALEGVFVYRGTEMFLDAATKQRSRALMLDYVGPAEKHVYHSMQ